MALLKTLVDFIIVIVVMIILVPIGLFFFLLSFLGFKQAMSYMVYRVAQSWALLLIFCTGCKVTVIGKENIPKTGGVCFVSNHESIFDILLILGTVGRPVGFIAKKELALIPVLNMWIFLLGGLFIDRKNIRKAIKTMNIGVSRIKKGKSMIIFPEGTRSKGQGLLPFRSGAFKLATQSDAPIVPIAIKDSYQVFEQTHRIKAIPLTITFSPPIITENLSPTDRRKHLADQVYNIIAEALEQGKDKQQEQDTGM